MIDLTEAQLATLRVVCNTVVPAIERAPDEDGFWARTATDVGADQALVMALATMPEDQAARPGRAAGRPGGAGLRRNVAAIA